MPHCTPFFAYIYFLVILLSHAVHLVLLSASDIVASPISPLQKCSPSLHSPHCTITQACCFFPGRILSRRHLTVFAFPFYDNKQFSQAPSSGTPRRRCTSPTGRGALEAAPLYRVSFDYFSILPYSSWVTGVRQPGQGGRSGRRSCCIMERRQRRLDGSGRDGYPAVDKKVFLT